MTRFKSTERLTLNYERIVERETDDEQDPHPSFPPMRVYTTDGETVEEITMPKSLVKCRAVPMGGRKAG